MEQATRPGGDTLIGPTKPPWDTVQGRRLRAFLAACYVPKWETRLRLCYMDGTSSYQVVVEELPAEITWHDLMHRIDDKPEYAVGRDLFTRVPLRTMTNVTHVYTAMPPDEDLEQATRAANASLSTALQDLADEVNQDIQEACQAFDDPDLYYPGVTTKIDPVADEHVRLVIWGMQRELNRETRSSRTPGTDGYTRLPAVTLANLPWRIQRALAERRRLRFAQWGIGIKQWEQGTFSLWEIPEDPTWIPRFAYRDNLNPATGPAFGVPANYPSYDEYGYYD